MNVKKTEHKRFLVDGELFSKYGTGRKWQAASTATKKGERITTEDPLPSFLSETRAD